eukprot:UN06696
MTAVIIRDSIYVGGLLGVTPILQNYLMKNNNMSLLTSGMYASVAGGLFAGIITTPFDCLSTCMKGDMDQQTYRGFLHTIKLRPSGGITSLFGGMHWHR